MRLLLLFAVLFRLLVENVIERIDAYAVLLFIRLLWEAEITTQVNFEFVR